jgi:hypothetical protein
MGAWHKVPPDACTGSPAIRANATLMTTAAVEAEHVWAQPFALSCGVTAAAPPSRIATATRSRPATRNARPAIHGLASVLRVAIAHVVQQRAVVFGPAARTWLVEQEEGTARLEAAGEDQQAALQSTEILPRHGLWRDRSRFHALHDRRVQRVALLCIGERHQQFVQFGGDELTGPQRTGRRMHFVTDAVQPSTLESTPEHVEHAIDEAPGQVAAEDADQHLPGTLAALRLDDEVRAERERERHDQPEQRLAHVRPGVEVSRSEIRHGPGILRKSRGGSTLIPVLPALTATKGCGRS